MNYTFTIKVDATNEEAALRVRNMVEQEIGAAFELESQDIKGVTTAHTGDLELVEDPDDAGAIDAARLLYEKEGEIEIDEGAKVSYSTDGGAYVSAWLWVQDREILSCGGSNPETGAGMKDVERVAHVPTDDTEGGHCD